MVVDIAIENAVIDASKFKDMDWKCKCCYLSAIERGRPGLLLL